MMGRDAGCPDGDDTDPRQFGSNQQLSQAALVATPQGSGQAGPPSAPVQMGVGASSSTRLLDWLRRSGARFPALALETGADGERLVRATRDIEEGEIVLAVPRRCLITTDTLRATAPGKALLRADPRLVSGQIALAAFLIAAGRSRRGPFAPYVRALPRSFPNVPLFFGEPTLALLHGTRALQKVRERWDEIRADHQALARAPGFGDVDLLEVARARTAVVSRVFGVHMHGRKREALAPLADMMNHRARPDVDWTYDDAKSELVMTALRAIPRGAEVMDSYGDKSNARFFVSYGFTLDDNPDDEALVQLALPASDPRFGAKAEVLRQLGGDRREASISARRGDEGMREVMSFLRIACASESELSEAASCLAAARTVPPLSLRNEAAAVAALGRACEEALSRFGSTIAEDEALLEGNSLPRRERLCVAARLGEKRVLAREAAVARAAVPLLRLPREALLRAIEAKGSSDAPIDRAACGVAGAALGCAQAARARLALPTGGTSAEVRT